MKREPKKSDAPDSRQWRGGLCLRCHAAAEGFAARNEGKIRRQTRHFCNRHTDGGMGEFGRVRPLRAALHIRKLIAQRGDAAFRKPLRNGSHEGISYAVFCLKKKKNKTKNSEEGTDLEPDA